MHVLHRMNPAWRTCFKPDTPNDVILRAVLLGRYPGTAYVDRLETPSEILIRSFGGKTFASAGATETFLLTAIDQARRLGWTALADTGIPESVRQQGRMVDRIRFENCDLESAGLQMLRERLTRDYEVQPLSQENLSCTSHAKRELAKGYGDRIDAYFDTGYGICVMYNSSIVSEAYAYVIAGDRMEVVVGTIEAFRGRGLASVASAYLAEESRRRGHTFNWSCLVGNTGSVKTARRLGFQTETPYREIYYSRVD